MSNPLIKSFKASAAVDGNLFAKAGTGAVAEATAATDKIIGVFERVGADSGHQADVILSGWYELRLGGNVAFGDPLTSDDEGRGVVAAPVADAIVRVGAFAMDAGSEGDIIPVFVAPQLLATPAEPA